ncbi:hypothetical protein HPB51_020014 [Rhipicephalus microplus]|uniref:Stalled ribosome sensor GCN1-like N-terminal domain-containing protein n=1 Tax=Rhipicephalus microplus TaxID=6941 RepID=A0A9J6E2W1_RHIMP|nr:hypothetical protein HPB51_020014 [Rhipicephalus microplus]
MGRNTFLPSSSSCVSRSLNHPTPSTLVSSITFNWKHKWLVEAQTNLLLSVSSACDPTLNKKLKRKINFLWKQVKTDSYAEVLSSLEPSYAVLLMWCYLIAYLDAQKQRDVIHSYKVKFLDVFKTAVLLSKTAAPTHVLEHSRCLLRHATHDDFKEQLVPALQKAMLRNPEIIMESVAHVLQGVTLELSPYLSELGKSLAQETRKKTAFYDNRRQLIQEKDAAPSKAEIHRNMEQAASLEAKVRGHRKKLECQLEEVMRIASQRDLVMQYESQARHLNRQFYEIQQKMVEEMHQTEIGEGSKQPGHMERSMYQEMITCEARLSNLESDLLESPEKVETNEQSRIHDQGAMLKLRGYVLQLAEEHLVAKDETCRQGAVVALKNLAHQCGSQEALEALIKHLVGVLNDQDFVDAEMSTSSEVAVLYRVVKRLQLERSSKACIPPHGETAL